MLSGFGASPAAEVGETRLASGARKPITVRRLTRNVPDDLTTACNLRARRIAREPRTLQRAHGRTRSVIGRRGKRQLIRHIESLNVIPESRKGRKYYAFHLTPARCFRPSFRYCSSIELISGLGQNQCMNTLLSFLFLVVLAWFALHSEKHLPFRAELDFQRAERAR